MPERFETNARTVSLLTLASRATGLARDATLSRVFGAGVLMDAFFLAFLVPNLFRRLFGEGALAAAFLPAYARLDRDDPAVARRVATLLVSGLVLGLGTIVIVGEMILLALSARAEHSSIATWLAMIMLPYMPLVCLVAILGAMLQVHGRFGPTAAAPIILNLCIIAAALGLGLAVADDDTEQRILHVGGVAAAVVLAGMLQVAWSLWALRDRAWWTARGVADDHDAGLELRAIARRAGPMIVGLGVLQLNTFIDGLIASWPTTFGPTILGVDYPLSEGAMAALSYAQRLYQFPLGVFGIAVATAIFPLLARQAGDDVAFARSVRRGLRLVVFIGLPAGAGLMLVARPLVATLLEGGAFTPASTSRVALVLWGYAPAIWAYSMIHVLTRAFYARGDAITPVRVAIGVVALNVALNLALIWTPLREAGLAWSTAICAIVQVMLLLAALTRRLPAAMGRDVTRSWTRSIGLTAAMVLPTGALAVALPEADGWLASAAHLGALVATGVAVVAALALALRMPEWRWALGRAAPDG